MEDNKNNPQTQLSYEELKKQHEKLLTKYDRMEKRVDKVIKQGDKQQKYVQDLNDKLEGYISTIDEHIITISVDKSGVVKSVSTAFKNAFGYKSTEIEGKEATFLADSENYDTLKASFDEVLNTGIPFKGEVKLQRKNESKAWVDLYVKPVYDFEEISGLTLICEDITDKKEVEQLKISRLAAKKYDSGLLSFMSSISAATLQTVPRKINAVLWLFIFAVGFFLTWSFFSEIDIVVKGDGRVSSLKSLQTVQSPKAGILTKVHVQESNIVYKGEILANIESPEQVNNLNSLELRLIANRAKILRLEAESAFSDMDESLLETFPDKEIFKREYSLFLSNKDQFIKSVERLKEELSQRESDLKEARAKLEFYNRNNELLIKELSIKKPLFEQKIISEVEFLKILRQQNELKLDILNTNEEIERLESRISEIELRISEQRINYQNTAKKDLSKVFAENTELKVQVRDIESDIDRGVIKSPVNGYINRINVKTDGAVVAKGEGIFEIVPSDDKVVAELRIKPSDIVGIYVGQDLQLKFDAYDYTIFGGIEGRILRVSEDTLRDEKGDYYYVVVAEAKKNYFEKDGSKFFIKPGMNASANIIKGKRRIINYILKPIMKTIQSPMAD